MRGVIILIWIFNGLKIIQPRKIILNGNKVEVIKILIQYGKVFLKHIQEDNKDETPIELDDDCLRIRFIKDVEQPVMDFDGNEVQPLVGDVFVFPEVLAKAMIKMGYAESASI